MGLELTEQQTLLRDSVARFLTDRYSFAARRQILDSELGWSPSIWQAFAEELGVLGAVFPEAAGGLGGNATDTMVLMEELGRALVLEPFLETVVLGGGVLKRCATPMATATIQGIVEGRERLAFAYSEPQARHRWNDILTRASQAGSGYVVDGRKSVVFGAPAATHLIVSVRTGGDRHDREGVALVLIDPKAPGVILRSYRTLDGRLAADVEFRQAQVPAEAVLATSDDAAGIIDAALDEAAAAVCAEAAGVLDRLVSGTVAYTKERRQFGAPIATFQVLQHRMVNMFVKAQQAAAMSQMAALSLAEAADDGARSVAAAKAFVGEACREVGQSALQLHGAMGITDELDISHYFKRAVAIESQFGSSDYHLSRFQQLTPRPTPKTAA